MANNGKTIYLTCREMAGLTRERAAELLSCGVRTLARWELGEALPPNDMVYRMFTLYPNGQYLAVEHLRNSSELGAAVLPAIDPCDLPKSLINKTKNKFNVSISEVDEQDIHQTIVLGLACVAGTVSHADSMIDSILTSIENNFEAEIIQVQREIR